MIVKQAILNRCSHSTCIQVPLLLCSFCLSITQVDSPAPGGGLVMWEVEYCLVVWSFIWGVGNYIIASLAVPTLNNKLHLRDRTFLKKKKTNINRFS